MICLCVYSCIFVFFFFFSSRRRHTRSYGDWSSDVCSSDLVSTARLSERWKRLLIAEPFGALLVSFSAMWLMRYVDGRFGWLLEASSALLALTFYLQSYLILSEVGRSGGDTS